MNRKSNFKLFLLVTVAVIAVSACNGKSASSPPSTENKESIEATYKKAKIYFEESKEREKIPPNDVVTFIDISGSMKNARLTRTQITDIESVLKVLRRTGGTFAIGNICDNSNQPFLRKDFREPPKLEMTSIPQPPENPGKNKGNPYTHRKKVEKYRQDVESYKDTINTIVQTLKLHEQQRDENERQNQQHIDELKPQIEEILQKLQACQNTDIHEAVKRANLLLEEPKNWSKTSRKYAIFITDGLDTFNKQSIDMKANEVILVNGSTESGVFQSIKHKRFEAPNAAFTTLASWMEKQ